MASKRRNFISNRFCSPRFFYKRGNMFTKLSSEQALNQTITLENLFINEFMPFAPEGYVKVYLLGLSMACCSDGGDNSPQSMAKKLNLELSTVMEAFNYWQEQGLVNITLTEPPVIEYLPVKRERFRQKFNKGKYKAFNEQLHAMLPDRMILPAEYNEYYSLMENMHIDAEAMLAIIAYCVRYKGKDIGYPYILAVARNLAHDGITSFEGVNAKLSEFDMNASEITAVIRAMGSRRAADINDRRLYDKWTKNLEFTPDTIVKVAKLLKKGSVEKLDGLLTKMYEKHMLSYAEIEDYLNSRDALFALAKEITRRLGVYYEQLDYFIESYVLKWRGYGFGDDILIEIAAYCFKHSVRTAEGMDAIIERYYKMGLTSLDAVNSYLSELALVDDKIKGILSKAGISRNVSDWDRKYYATWSTDWKMPDEVIEYAATKAFGKGGMAYVNSLLASYNGKNAHTLSEVQKLTPDIKTNTVITRKTAEELNAMLFDLKDEEI